MARSLIMIFLLSLLSISLPAEEPGIDRINNMYQKYKRRFKKIPDLKPLEVQELDQYILVDVREKEEIEVSRITGAYTLDEFRAVQDLYQKHLIVVYCTIGVRSAKWTSKLQKEGLSAVNLAGGILFWVHEGLPVTRDGQVVFDVHTFGRRWDLLPEGYHSVR